MSSGFGFVVKQEERNSADPAKVWQREWSVESAGREARRGVSLLETDIRETREEKGTRTTADDLYYSSCSSPF